MHLLKIIKSKIVNRIYNLGSGKEISINKLLSYLEVKKFLYQRDQENQEDL